MTTRAALRDETVSSGNGIGTPALAALLHERCQEDWQRRFDNGAQAITMHDVSAHDETARWLAARGVHIGCDTDLAYEAGREDGTHEATLRAETVSSGNGIDATNAAQPAEWPCVNCGTSLVVCGEPRCCNDCDHPAAAQPATDTLRAAIEEADRG